MKGMDKRISDLDLDTKISSHILRYASVSKCTKCTNILLDAPGPCASVDMLEYGWIVLEAKIC